MSDWMHHMRRGDFAAAWEISDAVLRARAGTPPWHLPRHEQWIWDGTPLDHRRVLVRCYHGLGDTIQCIRYAPLLKVIGAHVIVWAQSELLPLLATAEGVDELLPLHDGAPDVEYDVDVEIMELPHAFRSTVDTLPARVPYLHMHPAEHDDPEPARQDDGTLHAGLVWAAGAWDPLRSIPFRTIIPLTDLPRVTWHVLQRGPALADCPAHVGVFDTTDTVLDTARAMRALDLVVTVDSMPAHLAGALGVPVWTLLHADPDWRWADGDTSPWYPTMRLFRQRTPGDWTATIADVAHALDAFTLDQSSSVVVTEKPADVS